MRKTLFFLFAVLLSATAFSQNYLKIMSYNVRNGSGMDGVCNYQRAANVINNAQPDVVAIQEVDSVTGRSNQHYVLDELACRTQMHAYFSPAINFDGGKYGIGILSKKEPISLQKMALPGSEEARTLIVAEFEDYVFCCTHLSLTEKDRMTSLEIIKGLEAKCNKPFFIAGDMNAAPSSDFVKGLEKEFKILSNKKIPTWPADTPTDTIDYIAIGKNHAKGIENYGAQVLNEPFASDHRPILVKVRMAVKTEDIFRTKPYLQNPIGNGMTVMWETKVPTYSWVEFGTDTTNLQRARTLIDGQVLCNNTMHKIRLNNLKPGQKYYYRVCSQEMLVYQGYYKSFGNTAKSAFSHFTLPNAKDDEFTAVIFNDLHQHNETFYALRDQIKDVDYDFVVFNGDVVDDPWGHDQATRFISIMTEGVGSDCIPTFFIRGNHEIRNAYSVGLRDHYDYQNDKPYGAFNWGDTRIIMLDCGEDKKDDHWVYYGLNDFTQLRNDQAEFLKKEVKSKEFKKASRRVLIHHIPLYGNTYEDLCGPLWKPILEKAKFDLAINGHTHSYAYHPKGSLGNNYPVVIGGGYKMKDATVMVLHKTKDALKLKVIDTEGKVLLEETY